MNFKFPTLLIVMLVCVAVSYAFTFTVAQHQWAVRYSSSGDIVQSDYQPGLHIVNPFNPQIRKFDKRLASQEIAEEKYPSNDGPPLRISAVARWKIADIGVYCKSASCDESRVLAAISDATKKSLREMVAKRSTIQALAIDPDDFRKEIFDDVAQVAASNGVKLVEVRLLNIALPASFNDSVYAAMQSSFRQSAVQQRAKGDADAREIVALADRQKAELIANAQRDAAIIRGEADAQVAAMYAAASARNSEFFSFYRSLQSYRDVLGRKDDVLVISPDNDYFKYFNKPGAR